MKKTVDELLQTPYWIIDILPGQVPKDSPGQFFAVENYMRQEQMASIKQRHINLVLKLNCYLDISIDEEMNPSPEQIAEEMRRRYLYLMIGESMILSEPDDTHMTLFNPDENLLEMVRSLATAEGLFVWEGKE